MVCFVHNRKFLSKFHGLVNQLRKMNEFTTHALRQLPKQCCTCTEQEKNSASTKVEPLLTSLDIDALRFICLQLDIKRLIINHTLSSLAGYNGYTILSFPILSQTKQQIILIHQFRNQYSNEINSLEQNHQVRFEFVSPTTSKDLQNQVSQWKYDLVTKCSNYLDARQAIDSLWVIISTEDQSSIDAVVKDALQKLWNIFITNFDMNSLATLNNLESNHRSVIQTNKRSVRHVFTNRHQLMLKNRKSARSTVHIRQKVAQPTVIIPRLSQELSEDFDNEYDDIVEDVLTRAHTGLDFLFHKFQNSNKCRRPRMHRRQHILALAMVA